MTTEVVVLKEDEEKTFSIHFFQGLMVHQRRRNFLFSFFSCSGTLKGADHSVIEHGAVFVRGPSIRSSELIFDNLNLNLLVCGS